MNHGQRNNTANSSPPGMGSSLVTDANSGLSHRPQLQRNASINNESYMRLPSSPMSFSSINMSGSPVMDGSSIIQQSPNREQMKQGDSINITHGIKQETGINFHAQKRPRPEHMQDDMLQPEVIHQLLQRQESLQLQGHQNPHLNAIIQQHRLAQQRQQRQQQHQILQSMHRASLVNQMRPGHAQVQPVGPVPLNPVRRPSDGLCARRLMQYMYHQRHRPPDNSILYWRKFVAEYFAPKAKKRWCLSLYETAGSQALGAFPQAAIDSWHCDICGSKSGKGFEATYEVLPRLSQIKFDRGVVDELLFLDMPREIRLASGIMVLEYTKAIQESVYEQIRVAREGQLRITFTPDLKILSWEFCAHRHEELFSRRAIAPQVNQLLQVAHKYQTTVNESGTAGLPVEDLQNTCNTFTTAGRQLVRNLELHSLNDLGFSKRYVRCLQISEVVNSMKDLIDFSQESKIGPIESLKSYPRQSAANLQALKMQEMEQMAQSLSADQSTLGRMTPVHAGLGSQMNTQNNTLQNRITPLNNYHHSVRISSTQSRDTPLSLSTNPNQAQPSAINGSASNQQQPSSINFPHQNNGSTPNQQQQRPSSINFPHQNNGSTPNQQQQQRPSSINFPHQNNNSMSSQASEQQFEQHVIQQFLQEMEMMKNKGTAQQSNSAPSNNTNANANANAAPSAEAVGLTVSGNGGVRTGNNAGSQIAPSRNDSSKSNNNNNNNKRKNSSSSSSSSLNGNSHFPELGHDLMREFTEIEWSL